MDHKELDLSIFQEFPPQQRFYSVPRLSVSQRGDLAMNGEFRRRLGEARDFRGLCAPAQGLVLLTQEGEPNIHFAKVSGSAKNTALAGLLAREGYSFPVLYTMEWLEERRAWVGTCQEMAPPPELPRKGPGRRTRRRR